MIRALFDLLLCARRGHDWRQFPRAERIPRWLQCRRCKVWTERGSGRFYGGGWP